MRPLIFTVAPLSFQPEPEPAKTGDKPDTNDNQQSTTDAEALKLRKAETARRNGALSKGPVTAYGKSNSSRNALRHGMLAQSTLLDGECHDTFRAFVTSLEKMFKPKSAYEISLVETMAVAKWRMTRVLNMERAAISQSLPPVEPGQPSDPAARAFNSFRTLTDDTLALDRLNRYEGRCDRQYQRAVESLERHRAEERRKAEELRKAAMQ